MSPALIRSSISVSFLLATALLSAGCQQTKSTHHSTSAPLAAQQVQQLSSLIAASEYLRNKCDRADIPAPAQLSAAALRLAKKKRWDINQPEYQQLSGNSQQLYQSLLNDSVPVAQQCREFNLSIRPFINEAQSGL